MSAKGTWIEQVDKRTRNGKKRVDSLDPKHFAVDVTIGSIHYKDNPQDEAEQWKGIDNIFEPAIAPWNWQMLKAGYHIRVKEDFTAGQIIEFEKQGETVQFQPMALEWTNDLDQIQQISMPQSVTPAITNPVVDLLPAVRMPSHQGTIKWNDGYGEGLDFEWKCASTRLVKILEVENLNKLPIPEQYIIDGGNPVLRLNFIFDPSENTDIYVDGAKWDKNTKIQTFKTIRFDKKTGGVLWGFTPLLYWGSNPEVEDNQGQSVATLEKRGNKLYVSIRTPYEWLQNATYPVFIDQTVEVFPDHLRYFHADAWDGDLKWLSSEPDGASPASSASTNLNKTGDFLVQGFSSEAINEDSLSAGHWGFYLWGKHDGTTLVASLFVEVRKNDVNGDLIATSIYTPNLTTTETEHYCHLDFPQTAWNSGDKVWIGVYAHVTTKQAGSYAYFYYDHSTRLSRTANPTVDETVGAEADDGFTRGDIEQYNNSAGSAWVGNYSATSSDEDAWYRFTEVTISAGARIIEAYVTLRILGSDFGNDTRIYADDQSNPTAPTDYADHRARTRTANSSYWSIPGTGDLNSPSIVDVIQELVDSYDYSGGTNAIQMLHDADAVGDYDGAYFQTHEYGGNAADIHIEYTAVAIPRHGFVNFQVPGIV